MPITTVLARGVENACASMIISSAGRATVVPSFPGAAGNMSIWGPTERFGMGSGISYSCNPGDSEVEIGPKAQLAAYAPSKGRYR